MSTLDSAADSQGLLSLDMTDSQCQNAFDAVAGVLGVPVVTPKGRRRHLERMKWPTYLRNMPRKGRPARVHRIQYQSPAGGQNQQATMQNTPASVERGMDVKLASICIK